MAEQALKLVNGIPRMRDISGTGGVTIYDETLTVGVGGISSGSPITLPNSGTYDDDDLEVYLGGLFLEPGVDYNYVGAGPDKTQITMVDDVFENELLRFRVEDSGATIYDETTVIGVGGVTTGVNITLPNAGTYEGDDLEVFLNGEFMDRGIDWNEVGSAPRTDIQFTFDLVEGDRVRFRIDVNV